MLTQLLETKQATQRKTGGTLLSVALHLVVIAVAIQLTHKTATAWGGKPVEVIVRPVPKPDTPAPIVTKRPLTAVATAAPALGFQVLPRVVDIPPVNLGNAKTNLPDWTGTGTPGGLSTGTAGVTGPIEQSAPYFAFQVEKAAAAIPGSASPAYPEMLKSAGVEGDALIQFVVDTLGRVEPGSFKVLRSTHDAFGESVRAALPRMRFLPAEAGGTKVRMLVQQPFAFALNK